MKKEWTEEDNWDITPEIKKCCICGSHAVKIREVRPSGMNGSQQVWWYCSEKCRVLVTEEVPEHGPVGTMFDAVLPFIGPKDRYWETPVTEMNLL